MSNDKKIIWVASYPKSGNTWFRSFVVAYIDGPENFSLESLQMTIGDRSYDGMTKALGRELPKGAPMSYLPYREHWLEYVIEVNEGNPVVKTHEAAVKANGIALIPTPLTRCAVYLVRNPLDVAVSFAKYMNADFDEVISIMNDPKSILLSGPRQYESLMSSWSANVLSWVDGAPFPRCVLRYEDMLADPETAFARGLGLIGLKVDRGRMREAIEATRFERLKMDEAESGFVENEGHPHAFFNRGRKEQWREMLTEAQVRRVIDAHGEVMRMMGYSTEVL